MSYADSLDRLQNYWNSGTFNASTNPGGLANGGHRQVTVGTTRNFDVVMADIVEVMATGAGGVEAAVTAMGLAFQYTWDEDTADSDQGSGKVWIDNATAGSATTVFLSDDDAGGTDRSALYPRFGASTSAVKGFLGLVKLGDTSKYVFADVTATVDATGYYKLTVDDVDASDAAPFTAGDTVVVGFIRNGDKGETGNIGDILAQTTTSTPAMGDWVVIHSLGAGATRKITLQNLLGSTAITSMTVTTFTATTATVTGTLDARGLMKTHAAGQSKRGFWSASDGELDITASAAQLWRLYLDGDAVINVFDGQPDANGVYGFNGAIIDTEQDGSGAHSVVIKKGSRITFADDMRSTAEAGETRPWTDNNTSLDQNAAVGPNGLQTLQELIEDAVTGDHSRLQTISMSPNQTVTGVAVVRSAGASRNVRLLLYDAAATSNQISAIVNPATGAVVTAATNGGNATGATLTVVALPNSCFLIILTGKPNTSGSNTVFKLQLTNGTSQSYEGDGASSVYVGRVNAYPGVYKGLSGVGASRDLDAGTAGSTDFSAQAGGTKGRIAIEPPTWDGYLVASFEERA